MTRIGRRLAVLATTGALAALPAVSALPAVGAPGVLPSAAAAAGAAGSVSAVVGLTGPVRALPGVDIVASYPNLSTAVVRGPAAAVAALAHDSRVVGIRPDEALVPTGDVSKELDAAFAWEKLGGHAGRPDAGAGVSVALIDTGVSDTAALNRASGRLVDGVDTSPVAGRTARPGRPATDPSYGDEYGHGTFMASVLAGGPVPGTGERGLGVAPGATVVVVKVAGADGTTTLAAVMGGLSWVLDHASTLQVASFSFAHARPGTGYGADPLTYAVEQVQKHMTVVVSAGNTPGVVGDPGFDRKVLTVGAADVRHGKDSVASFSGSGRPAGVEKPDLVASGVGVLGVLPAGSTLALAHPDAQKADGLWRGSGTSQATAITAGAAAVLLQGHPAATPLQVKTSLRAAARPLPGDRAGAGLLRLAGHVVDGVADKGEHDGDGGGGGSVGTGEEGFDASSWGASSWGASSWGAHSWDASSWGASSWGASSWGASSWGASSWGAASWGAE
ncbi:MAG: S8 family serine peptidase [Actinomycetota bacterium]|nr:S8 family serine peptidase [Actinomycetota bacterium]